MKQKVLPFGTWKSTISPRLVAGASIRLGGLVANDFGNPLWIESRPEEGGRCVIVEYGKDNKTGDVLPPEFSARSRIHEYGGGALLAGRGGALYFTSAGDQDIYRLNEDGTSARLTNEPDTRFADYSLCPKGRGLFSVAERHEKHEHSAPENFLALVAEQGGEISIVRQGADFYAAPRVSPDGQRLAWLEWDLPHMPWQAAALYVARIADDGSLKDTRHIIGGEGKPAFQCEWDETGALYVVAEEGEWSHLYCWRDETLVQVSQFEGELARPLWALGMRSYVPLGNRRFAAVTVQKGEHHLWLIDEGQASAIHIDQPHRQIIDPVKSGENAIFAIVGDDDEPSAIAEIDMSGNSRLIHRSSALTLGAKDISIGQTLELEVREGETLFAVYYPPANAACRGPKEELPPMILSAHGGPTGCADRGLKLKIQYWTSRGYAFLDCDYRGSTGYGALYRNALDGYWGLRDADDMVAAAHAVIERKLADPGALLISGGSAGGYTALMALCRSNLFRAACISYGVADLATLLATTHKFEAGYLYGLTGTSKGNTEPIFTERSPLHQARHITSPVLLLQGLDDRVVPPEQSRNMARAIEKSGVAVSLREFAGEGHGFRGADTIRKALELETAFYAKHLGF